MVSSNPKEKVEPAQLLPTKVVLEDEKEKELQTDIVYLKANRPHSSFMEFLRQVYLVSYTGKDKASILISAPRSLEFEKIVLGAAVEMLTGFCRSIRLKEPVKVESYAGYLLNKYNQEYKRTAHDALKTFQVMKEMLECIPERGFAACFMATAAEKRDDEEEVFERRMAIRHYFRELRNNMLQIYRQEHPIKTPKEKKATPQKASPQKKQQAQKPKAPVKAAA